MKVYRLYRQCYINASLEQVWDFFSYAGNLKLLTPAYMNIKITSGNLPDKAFAGQIISYTLSPVAGISLSWITEITDVLPNKLFVDEQRRGPYKLWHHEHHFEEQKGKVLMTDIVLYSMPFSFIGTIARFLFIKRQLDNIFDYRQRQIETIFK